MTRCSNMYRQNQMRGDVLNGTSWMSLAEELLHGASRSLPESIDTSSMSTKFIDNVQIVNPRAVSIEILNFGDPARTVIDTAAKEPVVECGFHVQCRFQKA
jgi:hypothetical protein